MGDMKKILDQTVDEIEMLFSWGEPDRSRIEEALWKLWEAAYRDGYGDATEDLTE